MSERYDVAIIGSGFSGSILAWILASRGRKVALIDSATHPRFAIGESSTPIADALLRQMGKRYGLPELETLSAYGVWQDFHPQLACGRKRGFSYYVHQEGRPFSESPAHENSLMVAASMRDDVADTHWYRRDVDQFLFQQAIKAGTTDVSGSSVQAISLGPPHRLRLSAGGDVDADWIVDASGRASVTAKLLNVPVRTRELSTNTRSRFAHYRNVRSWGELLGEQGLLLGDDPFDTDDAAQHHLMGDRWMWMLRFNNGITSVGWTASATVDLKQTNNFPSIDLMLADAELVEPANGPIVTDRLQRLFDPVVGPNCVMLPSTACTIDPLHSTGIAHALAGVSRVAEFLLSEGKKQTLDTYRDQVLAEAKLLDVLVNTAYQTMHDLERFTAACMLYFLVAIICEEHFLGDSAPHPLWCAGDPQIADTVKHCCARLIHGHKDDIDYIRAAIEPWNSAGLMDPAVKNRYAYTATKR